MSHTFFQIESAAGRLALHLFLAAGSFFGKAPFAAADETIPFDRVAPIFQMRCHGCHGVNKPKGDLRLDRLNPDFVAGKDADKWREVLDRLNLGDMPPEKEPPLAADERELLIKWLLQERRRAELSKNPAAYFRRLTRREYERSMQELLGLPLEFAAKLPDDGRSKEGFRNNGEALRMSPLQYETFLQIAEEGLADAIVSGPAPEVHRYRLTPGEKSEITVASLPKPENRFGESFEYAKKEGKEKAFRIWNMSPSQKDNKEYKFTDGSLPPSAIRRHGEAAIQVPQVCLAIGFHRAFRKGEALVRVRVARVAPPEGNKEAAERIPVLTVAFGCTNYHGVELKTFGEAKPVANTDFQTYEIRVRMETMPLPNVGPSNDKNSTVLAIWNSAKIIKGEAEPPRMKIEWVEFENPVLEAWPPLSHTSIVFPNERNLPEPDYAREIVQRFAAKAYRRPLDKVELDRLMVFWSESRKSSESLEQSLRETLSVVLASPQFLGLTASRPSSTAGQRIDDHELAARLSYFLWSGMPDETLKQLAEKSQLRDPKVLAVQVRRMVKDPKAWQFVEQFTEQWLELDRLQRVTMSKEKYPGVNFDELLAAMRMESLHYFHEILHSDASIFQIIDSDFTCLNETLASHYGVSGVVGPQFRRVQLDPSHHRGGMLTHAAILTGNSDGSDGHPVKRGVWLMRNLLDEPPPPPPPNVPELNRKDPKVRDLTIPQALAVHRESNACNGCHRKIDPWGIAFEEYDALGNWQRDGAGAEIRKRRTRHPIESVAELPTGATVNGMKELQRELVNSKSDEFRRAMLRKVMAYALGRSLTLRDIEAADALVPKLKERGDKLGALIELVVMSEVFQAK